MTPIHYGSRNENSAMRTHLALHGRLLSEYRENPEVLRMLENLGLFDDLLPLQVPAIKAMYRDPTPRLNLLFLQSPQGLSLGARNRSRQREAAEATLCATLECPPWLFDSELERPVLTQPALMGLLTLVKESFAFMGVRIGNYFPVEFINELIIQPHPVPYLTLRPVPLSERARRASSPHPAAVRQILERRDSRTP